MTPAAEKQAEITALETIIGPVQGIIAGHSGIPFIEILEAHEWINAGVIGLPAHDKSPQTWFALLDEAEAELHPLPYDYKSAARAMQQAGLQAGYGQTLETGIWPSEGVLPPQMRYHMKE